MTVWVLSGNFPSKPSLEPSAFLTTLAKQVSCLLTLWPSGELPQGGLRTEAGPRCTKRHSMATRRWSSCCSRPRRRWTCRRTMAWGLCGRWLFGELRSIPTGFGYDSFLHIQRTMSLPHGLPEAELRCIWQLQEATWRWWISWWRWRRWGCKTKTAGGLSCRVPVDLWPWRFVVGFTWWQPAFKMQIKLHVFCKGNIHIL